MKCRDARIEIPDLLRGNAGAAAEAVAQHLASCPECAEEAKTLGSLLATIDAAPWVPPQTYWASILPRLHRELDQRSAAALPAWAARFALPAAAAVVLAVACVKVGIRPSEAVSDTLAGVISQMAPEELQEVADRQAVADALQPDLLAIQSVSTAEDGDNIETLIREDGGSALEADADAATGIEEPVQSDVVSTPAGTEETDSIHQ